MYKISIMAKLGNLNKIYSKIPDNLTINLNSAK